MPGPAGRAGGGVGEGEHLVDRLDAAERVAHRASEHVGRAGRARLGAAVEGHLAAGDAFRGVSGLDHRQRLGELRGAAVLAPRLAPAGRRVHGQVEVHRRIEALDQGPYPRQPVQLAADGGELAAHVEQMHARLVREVLGAHQDHLVGDQRRIEPELGEQPLQGQHVHGRLDGGGAHLLRITLSVDHREGLHLGDVEPRGGGLGGAGGPRAQRDDVGLDEGRATADVEAQQRMVGQQRLAGRDPAEHGARPLVPGRPVRTCAAGARRLRIDAEVDVLVLRHVEAELGTQQLEQRRAAVGLDLLLERDAAGDGERRLPVARREADPFGEFAFVHPGRVEHGAA